LTTHLELMRLHIEALFTHDANGDMVRVNEPNGGAAPRFFLGRTAEGVALRFRHDVDRAIRRQIETACEKQLAQSRPLDMPTDPLPYQQILDHAGPVEKTWLGSAFYLPRTVQPTARTVVVTNANAELLRPLLEPWLADVQVCEPMIALAVDDRAVSLCCSGRRTRAAHEAAVETAIAYRNRGYGSQVVRAWAQAVYAAGALPLYSIEWENSASRAVMRKLEVSSFGTDLHIT
jgi:hypothetical protein